MEFEVPQKTYIEAYTIHWHRVWGKNVRMIMKFEVQGFYAGRGKRGALIEKGKKFIIVI